MPAVPAARLRVQKPDFAFVSRNPSFMKNFILAVVLTTAGAYWHTSTARAYRPAPSDTLVPVQLNAVRVVPVSFISQSFVSSDRLLSSAPLAIAQLAQIQPGFHVQNIGNHTIKPVFRGLGGNRILTVYQGFRYDNQQGGGDHGLDLPLLGTSAIQLQPSLELGTEGVGGALIVYDLPLWGGLSRRLTQGNLAGLAQPGAWKPVWSTKTPAATSHARSMPACFGPNKGIIAMPTAIPSTEPTREPPPSGICKVLWDLLGGRR